MKKKIERREITKIEIMDMSEIMGRGVRLWEDFGIWK